MNKKDLIFLVKKIQSADGTETEIDEMIYLFESSVSNPEAFDYISSKEYDGWSAKMIVEKILEYKIQSLPPTSTKKSDN